MLITARHYNDHLILFCGIISKDWALQCHCLHYNWHAAFVEHSVSYKKNISSSRRRRQKRKVLTYFSNQVRLVAETEKEILILMTVFTNLCHFVWQNNDKIALFGFA